MTSPRRILLLTSEWPTPEHPGWAPYIVLQVEALRAEGIEVDVLPFRGGKNPVKYLKAWYQVRRYLRRKRYDLIHAHFGQSGLLALPRRIPLVVTYHGSDLEGVVGPNGRYVLTGEVLRTLSKFVATFADEVIVVSRSLAKNLPRRRSYNVIPGGMNLEVFQPSPKEESREALNLPKDRYLVLFGGRPDIPRKRFNLAQEAVDQLHGELDVEMAVLRDVPHTVVPKYMSACDVLLLTSIHEGSPTVVKEALACNLPVVTVDVGDVRERLDGVAGCIVCEDDSPQTLADALKEILNRKEPFVGRHLVEDLDERNVAKKVIDVYRSALQRWGK